MIGLFFGLLATNFAGAESISLEDATSLIENFPDANNPPSARIVQMKLQNMANRLPELQDTEVAKYLGDLARQNVHRGEGYRFARELSRANRQRVEARSRGASVSEYNLVRPAVSTWLAQFEHNMNQLPGNVATQKYWLSSQQLSDMHLPYGLQGAEFNRRFLGTQNWIFFFVGDAHDGSYGPHKLYMPRPYADSHGLIFPFVMTLHDLVRAMPTVAPQESDRLEQALRQRGLDTSRGLWPALSKITGENSKIGWQKIRDHADLLNILAAARHKLASFMFTAADFEALASMALADHLRAMDQYAFEDARRVLSQPVLGDDFTQLMRAAFDAAGLPNRFEMRVPVAIPVPELTMPGAASCEGRML